MVNTYEMQVDFLWGGCALHPLFQQALHNRGRWGNPTESEPCLGGGYVVFL